MSAEKTWPSSCTKCWWFSKGNCQTWSAFSSEVSSASSVPKSCRWKLVKRRGLIEFSDQKVGFTIPDNESVQKALSQEYLPWQRVTVLNHLMQSPPPTGKGTLHLLKNVSPPKYFIVDFAVWSPLRLLRTNLSSTLWPNARFPGRILANMSDVTASNETTAIDWRPTWSLRLTISKADLTPTWRQTKDHFGWF